MGSLSGYLLLDGAWIAVAHSFHRRACSKWLRRNCIGSFASRRFGGAMPLVEMFIFRAPCRRPHARSGFSSAVTNYPEFATVRPCP